MINPIIVPMRCNIRKTILLLTLLIIIFSAFGCASRRADEIQTRFYTFEYDPPTVSQKPFVDASVKIERFRSSSFYESNRIVFKKYPGKIDSYFYHRWWSRPSELVTYFLLRDMRSAGLFRAVLPFDTDMPHTHIIEGYIEEMYEKDDPDAWYAVLSINITLIEADTTDPVIRGQRSEVRGQRALDHQSSIINHHRLLFQKHYHQTEPCVSKTPLALAGAMSKAMAKLSELIIIDVYNRISR
jgi:ABC-type uncharacterized transport system auxiliary subunit